MSDQPCDKTGAYRSSAAEVPSDDLVIGTVIAGRFKLLERLGEGGMGTVYVAEQTEPIRRKVALKLIKAGMDSKSVIARFEVERQALALMDHPNIARVLDGGIILGGAGTPGVGVGRSFFVMEYIKGIPLTEYCDAVKLDIRGRLELFVTVCQAVQHAHQKGIIHRDLKPSNILVALYDGRPVAKVIDFGLAKAIHQPLTERSLYTGHQMVIGTPLYMSPEQSELNNLDIDTRTDIYSLGVILYELLTGTTPLDRERFKRAAWDEMMRLIREEEPARPSIRLSKTDTLSMVASRRHTEPAKLSKLIRGDLDWIVMKALAKERDRRYGTASSFAADVERFLKDEAVSAGPPTLGYKLRKLVRRNRGRVIAAGAILFSLVAGIVGTSIGLSRAIHESALKEDARREAVASAEVANAAEKERRAEFAKTAHLAARLAALRGQWTEASRLYERAMNLGVADDIELRLGHYECRLALSQYREARAELEALSRRTDLGPHTGQVLLERAYFSLVDKTAGDPQALAKQAVAAGLPPADEAFAQIYFDQNIAEAIMHLQAALRADPFHVRSLEMLTALYFFGGHRNEFRELAAQLQTLRPDSISSVFYGLVVHALDRDRAGIDRDTARLATGEMAAAAPFAKIFADVLSHMQDEEFMFQGPSSEQANQFRTQFVQLLTKLPQLMGAVAGKQEFNEWPMARLPIFSAVFQSPAMKAIANGNPLELMLLANQPEKTAETLGELARALPDGCLLALHGMTLHSAGRLREAEAVLSRAIATPSFANCRRRAWLALTQVQWQLANDDKTPIAERATWRSKALDNVRGLAISGPLNQQLKNWLTYIANACDESALALTLTEAWLRQRPDDLQALLDKCAIELQLGAIERAEETAWQFLDKKSQDEKLNLKAMTLLNRIGVKHFAAQHYVEACRVFEKLYPFSLAKLGAGHKDTMLGLSNLAISQSRAGKRLESLQSYEQLVVAARKHLTSTDPKVIDYTSLWIGALEQDKQHDRAISERRLLLDDQRKAYPADDPRLADGLILLGIALLNKGKANEAESYLRECLSIREKKSPEDWRTFNARAKLGEALLAQARHAEAEPLLLSGFLGMKAQEGKIPPRGKTNLVEAAQCLVNLATATGNADEAAKWRKELEARQK